MEASAQEAAGGCLILGISGERRDVFPKYAKRTVSIGSFYNMRGIDFNVYFIFYELFSTNKVDKT